MIEQHHVQANGVDFAYLSVGEADAPLALCLHGFPDSPWGWRHLLPQLAAAGFRAVAPFQRGYAPTAVPADGLYQSGVLGVDANALHAALGGDDRAVIIGHDWGAAGTWAAAALAPERWSKVVAMAVPSANTVPIAFLNSPQQLKRSWYMFFFQSPLADMIVPGNDLAFIDMLWADWSPGYDASEDVAHVKDCLRDPANLAAALGYYRATLGAGKKDPALDAAQAATQAVPSVPTLYMHGRTDGCIGVDVAEMFATMAPPNVKVHIVEGAGHFLQLERPDEVNRIIVDFLG